MSKEFNIVTFNEGFTSEGEAEKTGIKGWSDLVINTYGFGDSAETRQQQFDSEYKNIKEGKIIAITKENIVIASLVVVQSKRFQEYLAYGVNGIAVAKEHTGKGLGTTLYKEMIKNTDADIVVGSTKTPSAVVARSKGLVLGGMNTFYGYYETTSEASCGYTLDHEYFLKRDTEGRNADPETSVYLKNTSTLHEVGDKNTAVMPLLSIRKKLLYG